MNEEIMTGFFAGLFHQRADVTVGPGDDAAVLDLHLPDGLLLAAADQLILDRHYTRHTSPADAARKLLRRNLSDIAAMGGVPTHALVTVAENPLEETSLREFHSALEEEARRYEVSVIGGDVASLPNPGKVASLTILGIVKPENLCLRSNGKSGDLLYCTGSFGNSFASGHHLTFLPRLKEAAFLAGRFTNTMMDVSDGLLKDVSRMAKASSLDVVLPDPALIPLRIGADLESALTEGEDYELVFAVNPNLASRMEQEAMEQGICLTRIGSFQTADWESAGQVLDSSLQPIHLSKKGFDHFS